MIMPRAKTGDTDDEDSEESEEEDDDEESKINVKGKKKLNGIKKSDKYRNKKG